MIVHELATNAAKHGALSKVDGRLRISWKESDQTITIDWEEENGPPIGGPQSSNFGTKLIRNLATSLSGEATIEFLPSGARFALNFPKSSAGSHRSQANGGHGQLLRRERRTAKQGLYELGPRKTKRGIKYRGIKSEPACGMENARKRPCGAFDGTVKGLSALGRGINLGHTYSLP